MSNYTEFVTKGGQKLLVKRVPRNMLARFAARLPMLPRQPLQRIPIEGGETLQPFAEGTPEHDAWREKWEATNTERNLKMAMAAVHLGVRLPKEQREAIKADVDELRERAIGMGIDIHDDDETAYIWEFCLEDTEDMRRLNEIMYATQHPTEGAVAAATDTFRGDVQGQEPVEAQDTTG